MTLVSATRINDPPSLDPALIDALIRDRGEATIQFSRAGYAPRLLAAVNALCRRFGERLEVRFYGHYGGSFDAAVLAHLPNVAWLSVDCLTSINNAQAIGVLPRLTRLSLGVYELADPAFLASLPLKQLTRLVLGEMARKNLDLRPLAAATRLEALFLNDQSHGIEVIARLPGLHTLSLGSFPNRVDLAFLRPCAPLRRLTLILGGRTSIDEFAHANLEELAILRVRGLTTPGDLTRFPCLERLQVEDQLQIERLDVTGAPLKQLIIHNCKNLSRLDGLETLDRLAELRVSRTALDYEMLAARAWPPTMSVVGLYSGSSRRNERLRAALAARGYAERPLSRH